MYKREATLYLEDIITSINRIYEYVDGLSLEKFTNDWKTIDAVIRNLEIIGEAARNMPEEMTEKYSDIPWGSMISMRNKVIHEYFGVDVDILWKTIKEDLRILEEQIKNIL